MKGHMNAKVHCIDKSNRGHPKKEKGAMAVSVQVVEKILTWLFLGTGGQNPK